MAFSVSDKDENLNGDKSAIIVVRMTAENPAFSFAHASNARNDAVAGIGIL
jgi:hypothetical protein